jgi:hypothetical protein
MTSEETPLVSSLAKHEEVYKRFKPAKKRSIVALVSVTGLLARVSFCLSCLSEFYVFLMICICFYSVFVSGTFVPSIPQIAKDLDSTGSIVRC